MAHKNHENFIVLIKNFFQQDPASMFKLMEGPDGQLLLSIPMDALQRDKLPKYYCFAKGRHSGSFFLKVLLKSDLRKLEGNGPVEPAASRAIEDKHVVHVQ